MILDSKKDKALKEASLSRLRDQYAIAVESGDTLQIKRLEAIFRRLKEQPEGKELKTTLKRHTKN